MIFTNRQEAGLQLAQQLAKYRTDQTLVLGLARGGVVVARSIADTLRIPLDVLVVKKLARSIEPELAIGALAPGNTRYIDWRFAARLGIDEDVVNKELIPRVQELIDRRMAIYRRGRKPRDVRGKTVILTDDGAATGATMFAALSWVKRKKARKVVVAVPVAPSEFINAIRRETDGLVVLHAPEDFRSVGQFYKDFPQVSDEEVVELLRSNRDTKIQRY